MWSGIETKQIVAEVGGKIVGFVEYCKTVNPHEEVVLTTTDFAVLPEFQTHGIGKALIDELKQIAKKMSLSKLYMSTTSNNIPSIMFHLKNGAKIDHVEEIEEEPERWGIKGKYSIAFVYYL